MTSKTSEPKKKSYKRVGLKKVEPQKAPMLPMAPTLSEVNGVVVKVVKHPSAKLPQYQTAGAAGCDVCANILYPRWIEPGQIEVIDTGLTVANLPQGYELQLRPRSGLAARYGVTVLNSPGTIDSDYRGPIKVILVNHGKDKFEVERQMRIGQLVLQKVEQVTWELVDAIEETPRGSGGLGSTGA